jgi:hypothetical protein
MGSHQRFQRFTGSTFLPWQDMAARVKLFNLQGRIPYAHGKKTPTPSFYPSLVRMPMASSLPFPCPDFHGEKTPSHFP